MKADLHHFSQASQASNLSISHETFAVLVIQQTRYPSDHVGHSMLWLNEGMTKNGVAKFSSPSYIRQTTLFFFF
jgi:hypothetical protein